MYKYLKENPICEICGYRKSKHVHHIIPVSEESMTSILYIILKKDLAVRIPCHSRLHPEYSNFILSTIYNKKPFSNKS